jgi:SAM-dependent methyltransferase
LSSIERVAQLVRHPPAAAHALAWRGRRLADKVRGRQPVIEDGFAADDPSRCMVCRSMKTELRELTWGERTYPVRVCNSCRYVSNFDNTVDYTKFQSVDNFSLTTRVGTEESTGREFHMAKMGADILKRSGLRVMVFGAGRSLDYQHIARLDSVERVIMSDVVDLRGEADFINIAKGTSERFDLIIACEVVEHFPDPMTEFPRLFDLLAKDGLLICSTNIYDGRDLTKQRYLYLRGHVSYYGPRAIAEIARRSNILFDFRLPAIALGPAGLRKRYVLFTHSLSNLQKIAVYFGRVPYAPSEPPEPSAAAPAAVPASPAAESAVAADSVAAAESVAAPEEPIAAPDEPIAADANEAAG